MHCAPVKAGDRARGQIGILMLAPVAALCVAGCESEMSATRQSNVDGGGIRARADVSRSNIGSLRADTADDPPALPQDVIKPGDQVQVMVWGYPEFNTTTTVKSYGTITLPLVGDVIAAGFTENQFARTLKQRLSEYIKGDARVNISHVSMNNWVSVMGSVNKQGNYSALGEMSLIEILADAGGTATDADLRHVKIIRQGKEENAEEVNLQRYLESGSFEKVPAVRPGDTVFVPAEENVVRRIASFGQDILLLFGFFALLR